MIHPQIRVKKNIHEMIRLKAEIERKKQRVIVEEAVLEYLRKNDEKIIVK